jgi:hypothetical protein
MQRNRVSTSVTLTAVTSSVLHTPYNTVSMKMQLYLPVTSPISEDPRPVSEKLSSSSRCSGSLLALRRCGFPAPSRSWLHLPFHLLHVPDRIRRTDTFRRGCSNIHAPLSRIPVLCLNPLSSYTIFQTYCSSPRNIKTTNRGKRKWIISQLVHSLETLEARRSDCMRCRHRRTRYQNGR